MSDSTQGVRRRIANEQHKVNETFSAYVQSTAFSLSLSRRQIGTLTFLEVGIIERRPYGRWPIDVGRINQLIRRGLVTHHHDGGPAKPDASWADNYEITRAGKLVLDLLVEAGLVEPVRSALPPPPPGWIDPRPRLVCGGDGEWLVER